MAKLAIAILLISATAAHADQAGVAFRAWSDANYCATHPGDTYRCKPVPIDTRPVVWVPR